MDETVKLAEQLGKAIAGSPQAARLQQARKAMEADKAAASLLKDFNAQADRIAQLEQQNKPIEVDDKRKLQDLHDKLVACQSFKQYQAAQVEYMDLMRQVSQAVRQPLADTEGN